MLEETLQALDPRAGAVVVDATVGAGGHAEAVVKAIGGRGRLIGIDRDEQALRLAAERLHAFRDSVSLVHGHFGDFDNHLNRLGIGEIDGALFDLGVSSMQLDNAERGFSFKADGPLDMRMDAAQELSAAELINTISIGDLTELLRAYGQERLAGRIARAIVRRRPFATTGALADTIRQAVPSGAPRNRIDPATRSFQAIRIAVNRELEILPAGLKQAIGRLKPGGRIVVLSYHSLEHRIVRIVFQEHARKGILEILTDRPIEPSTEEVERNPRSRSAQLRAAARLKNSSRGTVR